MKTVFCPVGCWGEISTDTALCHKNTKQPQSGPAREGRALGVIRENFAKAAVEDRVLLAPPECKVPTFPAWRTGKVRGTGSVLENCPVPPVGLLPAAARGRGHSALPHSPPQNSLRSPVRAQGTRRSHTQSQSPCRAGVPALGADQYRSMAC